MSIRILHGDCLAELPKLIAAGEQYHACVCDPPYHLTSIVKRFGKEGSAPAQFGKDGAFARASKGFMGRTWDGGEVSFCPETWRLVFDALLPGAYAVVFSGSRTFHRVSIAMEDAGFIMHPFLAWIFGQGFPKAHKVEAEGWEGWRYGLQSLKPAIEPILLMQKPMSENNGTANVLKHGTGALNIDASRVPSDDGYTENCVTQGVNTARTSFGPARVQRTFEPAPLGRWPANVLHDSSEEVLAAFAEYGDAKAAYVNRSSADAKTREQKQCYGDFNVYAPGLSTKPCGTLYTDSGSAARFYYTAKADSADRANSKHPTVKPVSLIEYLVRLVTPPDGRVLDCFAGSGTTGEACMKLGFDCTLIEKEAEYVKDIEHRIKRWSGLDTPLFVDVVAE